MRTIKHLTSTIETLSQTVGELLVKEEGKPTLASASKIIDSTAADISARYWLTEFFNVLSRKEMLSIANGFLIQLLSEDQAKKLIQFLILRYPQYYTEDFLRGKAEKEDVIV